MIGDSDTHKHFDPFRAEKQARDIRHAIGRKRDRDAGRDRATAYSPGSMAATFARSRRRGASSVTLAPVNFAPVNFARDAKAPTLD
jgi:hypothetical protein